MIQMSAGMELGSPDMGFEEINDAQKQDASFSVGKLDLNLAVSREEGSVAYTHETGAWDETAPVNLNQRRQHDSLFFPSGVQREESDSICMKSSLLGGTELDHDEYGEKSVVHDSEALQSPLKDKHYQSETGVISSSPSGRPPYLDESETFPKKRRTEEAHCLWDRITDNDYQEDEGIEKANSDPCWRVKDYFGNSSKDTPHEKTESTYEEIEEGASDFHAIKLLSPEKMQDNGDKRMREDLYHSNNSPSEDRKMERLHLELHSPQVTPKRPASSGSQISVSIERSPYIEQCPQQKISSPQGDQEPSYSPRSSRKRHSPRSSRKRHSPSPQKLGGDSKQVPSQGYLHPSGGTSISPGRLSRQDSQRRGAMSPRRHNSPPLHGKQERSMLRSPIRRRDSSSGTKGDHRGRSRSKSPYTRKGDHRGRSRSKSPYTRDRYRSSPRRRYSPSHRPPPSRYYSSRRSPRRRPWSPPPNRNTGIGRPGNILFVAGFNFLTTERDLERKFSRFGRVRDIRIVRDKRSGDSRGFGFLSLERDEDADAAIRALDQKEWNGRIVLVEKSKTPAG